MTADKPERRKLVFATLDDVLADVEMLRVKGYRQAGNWDLAQICFHLSEWMRFPMDGFPKAPWFVAAMLWTVRKTMGKMILRKVTTEGMPVGSSTMPETIGVPGDPSAAIEKLKGTIARFQAHTGLLHPSPMFGALSKDEATRLQLVHCAHHLSFLTPSG